MDKKDAMFYTGALLVIVGIGIMIGSAMEGNNQDSIKKQLFRQRLQDKGFAIQNAVFHSPAITILLDSENDFIAKAEEIGTTEIYNVNGDYVAIDKSFTYSWSYKIPETLIVIGFIIAVVIIVSGILVMMTSSWV